VADDAFGTDAGGMEGLGVHDGAVLDRGPGADHDPPGVAPQHRTGPHGRFGADGDVTDHDGIRVDVGRRVDGGDVVAERVDGHRAA
jgi:hypothetical protein